MQKKGFHEVLFPLDVGFGSSGGPERKTDIVTLASGFEERNSRWADSRRTYDAGIGVRSLADIQNVLAFFEERRGRLHGFRFRDPLDYASVVSGSVIDATDQALGVGDGSRTEFQLIKTYGSGHAPYERIIRKPVAGSARVAVAGSETSAFSLNYEMGLLQLDAPPSSGQIVTAGFLFDVPVRFDTDRLDLSLAAFEAGELPSIPLVELRL